MNHYIDLINNSITADLLLNIPEASLREPIVYSLTGGKRWRPIIYLSLFETSNINLTTFPVLIKMCLFLEYIHTASLILDDMPMMDNDDYRRDRLTLHKVYGEASCKLSALQLLLLAQKHFNSCLLELKCLGYYSSDNEYMELNKMLNVEIYKYLGISGLCYGQHMDLNLSSGDKDKYMEMITNKTGSLFILSFKLGYVLSRRTSRSLDKIEEIGKHFGYLYQILDDIEDYEDDKDKHNNNILMFYEHAQIKPLIYNCYNILINNINSLSIGCITLQNILLLLKKKWFKTKSML
jgi:geranylgeranyl pyrophosphate synthase